MDNPSTLFFLLHRQALGTSLQYSLLPAPIPKLVSSLCSLRDEIRIFDLPSGDVIVQCSQKKMKRKFSACPDHVIIALFSICSCVQNEWSRKLFDFRNNEPDIFIPRHVFFPVVFRRRLLGVQIGQRWATSNILRLSSVVLRVLLHQSDSHCYCHRRLHHQNGEVESQDRVTTWIHPWIPFWRLQQWSMGRRGKKKTTKQGLSSSSHFFKERAARDRPSPVECVRLANRGRRSWSRSWYDRGGSQRMVEIKKKKQKRERRNWFRYLHGMYRYPLCLYLRTYALCFLQKSKRSLVWMVLYVYSTGIV